MVVKPAVRSCRSDILQAFWWARNRLFTLSYTIKPQGLAAVQHFFCKLRFLQTGGTPLTLPVHQFRCSALILS